MVTTKTKEICRHCGSHLIISDEDGNPYCLMCGIPYHTEEATKELVKQKYGGSQSGFPQGGGN